MHHAHTDNSTTRATDTQLEVHEQEVDQNISGPPTIRRYRTIMADPPWDIGQKGQHGASDHYDVMSLERIKSMPVADLAEEDAHLYLWVINGAIKEGLEVMEAWGFTYRSPLTWIKPRFGLGPYLRNQTEHLLLGTRGKAPVKFRGQGTWMYAPLQDHSHKPEEQYAVIERLSHGPFLELFARRRQPRWDAWGNQIESDVIIPGYPIPSDLLPPAAEVSHA